MFFTNGEHINLQHDGPEEWETHHRKSQGCGIIIKNGFYELNGMQDQLDNLLVYQTCNKFRWQGFVQISVSWSDFAHNVECVTWRIFLKCYNISYLRCLLGPIQLRLGV